MNTKQAILAAAFSAALLAALAPAHGLMTPQERSIERKVRESAAEQTKLGPFQKAMLDGIFAHMEKQVQRLREKDRQFPGQHYGALAGQLTRHIAYLKSCEFKFAPKASEDEKAFVMIPGSKTVHLCPSFFKKHNDENTTEEAIRKHEKKFGSKSTWRREVELAKDLRLGTQASILIHEMVHSGRQTVLDKLDLWDRGEGQAYAAEYKWLKVLNEDVHAEYRGLTGKAMNSMELDNVLSWLKNLGAINKADDDEAMKKYGGPLQIPCEVKGKLPFEVLEPPAADEKALSGAGRSELLKQVDEWEKKTVAMLRKNREEDPERIANKNAYLAALKNLKGGDRELTCPSCGYGGVHWWFSDRWSCPRCEHCQMPSEVLGVKGSGKTYRQVAIERMRLYDQNILDVQKKAAELRRSLEKKGR